MAGPKKRRRVRASARPRIPKRWTPRKILVYASGAAAVVAVIAGAPAAIRVVWPFLPAWIGFVESHTTTKIDPIEARLRQSAVSTERLNVTQLKAQLDEARRNPDNKGPAAQYRIEELETDLTAAQERLKAALAAASKAGSAPVQ